MNSFSRYIKMNYNMNLEILFSVVLWAAVCYSAEIDYNREETSLDGQPCSVLGISVGERKFIPNRCAPVTCNDDGLIKKVECNRLATEPPCSPIPGDLAKPYPDCCWKVVCGPTTIRPIPTPPRR